FGEGNPRPVFAATRVELVEPPRRMGEGQRHLALKVNHYGTVLRAIAFGRGEWADQIAQVDGPFAISFAPNINRFRGQETVELRLIDWRAPGQAFEHEPAGTTAEVVRVDAPQRPGSPAAPLEPPATIQNATPPIEPPDG
ncbi:MAG: hypothetical protein GXP27_00915, partial [Planctomycetes bacterium]|nr:hypothetical protein [Planctomycetota bacterium]